MSEGGVGFVRTLQRMIEGMAARIAVQSELLSRKAEKKETVMKLYEITTGRVGESYVRAYAWAVNEEHARSMFEEVNPGCPIQEVRLRLDPSWEHVPFCTVVSDCGDWVKAVRVKS